MSAHERSMLNSFDFPAMEELDPSVGPCAHPMSNPDLRLGRAKTSPRFAQRTDPSWIANRMQLRGIKCFTIGRFHLNYDSITPTDIRKWAL